MFPTCNQMTELRIHTHLLECPLWAQPFSIIGGQTFYRILYGHGNKVLTWALTGTHLSNRKSLSLGSSRKAHRPCCPRLPVSGRADGLCNRSRATRSLWHQRWRHSLALACPRTLTGYKNHQRTHDSLWKPPGDLVRGTMLACFDMKPSSGTPI